jgi:hypothetical protein
VATRGYTFSARRLLFDVNMEQVPHSYLIVTDLLEEAALREEVGNRAG